MSPCTPRWLAPAAPALLALLLGVPPARAQFSNPGSYVSPDPAGSTEGPNVLFFGNSFTISSQNPAVHTPGYGGARGIPELVRQIALAAGREPPFVKNVFTTNKGLDYHLQPGSPSLAEIDEPALEGETWDFVVLQGFSTRPTRHPYTGNSADLRANALALFDEVRVGSTNHTLASPQASAVLYQTWARQPGHWVYDPNSNWTSGSNIPQGTAGWSLGPLFASAQGMAAQVRTGYEQARLYLEAALPASSVRVAPAGDAWEAASWGEGWQTLFAPDHYHANSWGDLATALTLYGTLWDTANTTALAASGALDPTLAAIGVPRADALVIAGHVDGVLGTPPVPEDPTAPDTSILIDFSQAAGSPSGPEVLPHAGRYYNLVADHEAGVLLDAVDTRNVPTGVDLAIVDGFADETSGGATGAWIGAFGLSGSLYAESAQLDSFFVGNGFGYTDGTARLIVRDLNPQASYRFRFHGSRNSAAAGRVGYYTVGGRTVLLDGAHNLNLVADVAPVRPDVSGRVEIAVTDGGLPQNFGYLAVLEITRIGQAVAEPADHRPALEPSSKP